MKQSNNPYENVKLELKRGFDSLVSVRQTVANQYSAISQFTVTSIIASINRVFNNYFNAIGQQEQRQLELKNLHAVR